MTRWQRRMFRIDALMCRAAACEKGLIVNVYIDSRKLAEAIRFRTRTNRH